MAKSAIETIDGQPYLVTRDDDGNIIKQEGRAVAAPTPPVSVSKSDVVSILTVVGKTPDTFTLADVAAMLQFLLKKLIAG